ncbi:hypothetical protein BHM03_00015757 [Ensete ventricosum]|nr:hypothetical protein BHM03_00015757 [Ensete ventricosum]
MQPSASGEAAVLAALTSRGWRIKEHDEEIRDLIRSRETAEAVESELLNMDLRSFGGKSLPDPTSLKKLTHLQGPKILQVGSVRDIYQSSIDGSFKTSQRNRRLLRFALTDGQNEVIAIEYYPISTISEETSPGTKVCLESRIPVHSGILCLNPKVVTVLGGLVQSLHEEWQISQKFSGFSRTSLKLSKNDDGTGPPSFEKLQIEEYPNNGTQPPRLHGTNDRKTQGDQSRLIDRRHLRDAEVNKIADNPETDHAEDKPVSSEVRPKEVSEAVPVQNQAAAQKLLQKMSQPAHKEMHSRVQKHKFKAKQEEAAVFTLDEWERTKGMKSKPMVTGEKQDTSRDEELARRLQDQLDLEDFNASTGHSEAEQIRRSMFSFVGAEERKNDGRGEFRGRGRGRGRGKRRFG